MNTLIMLNLSPYLLGFHEIQLISPRISPDNTKVAYVDFRHNKYVYVCIYTYILYIYISLSYVCIHIYIYILCVYIYILYYVCIFIHIMYVYIYMYISTIFLGHLHTGYEYCLRDLKGTAFAPRFSNDWKKVYCLYPEKEQLTS